MFNQKILIATFSVAIPFLPLKVLAQDTPQQGYVGFVVEDDNGVFQEVEKLVLDDTKECINKVSGKEIAFVSDNTPTANDRRVIITNVTKDENSNYLLGDVNDLPYSDREYEQDLISEDIKVAVGLEHDDDKLAVTTGQNQFKYEIVDITERDGQELETIIEDGQFSITVETPLFTVYSVTCESIKQQEEAEQQQWLEDNRRWQEQYQEDRQREQEEEWKRELREDSDRRLQESWQEDLDDRWEDRYQPELDLQQQIREDSTRQLLEDLKREY